MQLELLEIMKGGGGRGRGRKGKRGKRMPQTRRGIQEILLTGYSPDLQNHADHGKCNIF